MPASPSEVGEKRLEQLAYGGHDDQLYHEVRRRNVSGVRQELVSEEDVEKQGYSDEEYSSDEDDLSEIAYSSDDEDYL